VCTPYNLLSRISRAVVGVLKGFDQLVNLVLDDTTEYLPSSAPAPGGGAGAGAAATPATRHLGLVVCRGTVLTVVCPEDGLQEVENPFLSEE
jgi:U6 snRNA-associated Sm-like protein LSm7